MISNRIATDSQPPRLVIVGLTSGTDAPLNAALMICHVCCQ